MELPLPAPPSGVSPKMPGQPACQMQKSLPLVKDTDGCYSLKTEAAHVSKGKDVPKIAAFSLSFLKT
jgi:hypothetical protein